MATLIGTLGAVLISCGVIYSMTGIKLARAGLWEQCIHCILQLPLMSTASCLGENRACDSGGDFEVEKGVIVFFSSGGGSFSCFVLFVN